MEAGFRLQASTISVSHVIMEIIVSVNNVNCANNKELFRPQIFGGKRVNVTYFSSSTCVFPRLYHPTGVPCPFVHISPTLSNPSN